MSPVDAGPPDVEQSQSSLVDETEQTYGDTNEAVGPLMEGYPNEPNEELQRKIAKLVLRMWESQDKLQERVEAQWKVNAARRIGISNAKVVWDDLDTHWTAWLPPGASPDVTPDVNKAATLCRRAVSNLFADPPAPEVVPASGEDDDIAAAEFSTRVLVDLLGETGLNEVTKARTAFDRASTFGSAYECYHVDSKGGGKVPVEVQARTDATHVDNALVDPATVQTDMAGQPIPGTGIEQGPYSTRYVMEDGTLTDDKKQAVTRWSPALKSEIVDGRHLRLIPHTADDIWDAHGALKATFRTWGELKQLSPDLANIKDEHKKAMLSYRPKKADDLIPGGKDQDVDTSSENEDERLVFTLSTYYRQCEDYPEGVYLITVADQFILHRSTWVDPESKEALDVPITQYKQFQEGRDGYPGVGFMEILGGGNELRAGQVANWLDHLEKLNNRKIFVPTNSTVQPEQLSQPRGTVVQMNPGGKPEFEDIPPFPSDALAFIEFMSNEMDSASGLLDTAQETSDAGSGRQAYAIISQVHAGLSEPRENSERAFTRGCRVVLQLARAFFDVPRELRWNENGKYRHKAWVGADLTTTTDVRVKPGTMTMLAPVAKSQLAEHFAELGIIAPNELREMLASNVGGTIGLQDDPFRARVRNQLSEWSDGAQTESPPAPPMMAPQIDPMTGQPLPPPNPYAEELAKIFEPTPGDLLPGVAQIRVDEIARFMASGKYLKHEPAWRQGLDMEYQAMIQAAAPPPPMMAPSAGPGGGSPPNSPEPLGGLPEEAQIPGGPPPGMAGLAA